MPEGSPGLTRLGLGTATFIPGYGVGQAGAAGAELVREAIAGGIRYIDTAGAYGDGERILGELATLLEAQAVRLCVKIPPRDPAALPAALERLHCVRVDSVLIHNAGGAELADPDVAEAMQRVKSDGVALRTGASTYGDDALRAVDQPWVDVVQVEHSILNPSVVRALRGHLRPGQDVAVRSVLCKGLLTARRSVAALGDEARRRLDELERLAHAWGFASLAELAVRFALDTPGVAIVLVGVGSSPELATALSAAARPALAGSQLGALAEFDASAEDWTHPERWNALV